MPDQVDVVDRSGEVEKKSGNRLKDEIDTVKRKRKRKHAAVELDEVPVCHGCEGLLIETGPHREEVETFLGRSNVNQHDGGLGEQRWERIKNSLSEELTEYAQPSKARRLASLFEDSSKGSGDASSVSPLLTHHILM